MEKILSRVAYITRQVNSRESRILLRLLLDNLFYTHTYNYYHMITSFRCFFFTLIITCTAVLAEVSSVLWRMWACFCFSRSYNKNWLVSSRLDSYNLHSDWIERTILGALVSPALMQRTSCCPFNSGETYLLFKRFLGNSCWYSVPTEVYMFIAAITCQWTSYRPDIGGTPQYVPPKYWKTSVTRQGVTLQKTR
jgi:hypothetical protein